MKKLTDILPKITQWEAIPYVADLMCKDCEMSGFSEPGIRKPNLVGWCETDYGFQAVFECTECGSKYRFHGGRACDELDEFDLKLGLHFAKQCENWKEIKRQLV